ncbi:MAG: hypothetical protein FWH22_08100 [Fibromonadales bacterium]|nr:hypothetical protein [Fibromonadales bacterium]
MPWQNTANIHCSKEGKKFCPYSVDYRRIIIAFIPNMTNTDTENLSPIRNERLQHPNIHSNTVYLR